MESGRKRSVILMKMFDHFNGAPAMTITAAIGPLAEMLHTIKR
jgi:hypothetical protein